MVVEGHHSQGEIRKQYPKWKKLDPNKILRGKIYVIISFEDGNEIRGKLILSPDAEIAMHRHIEENETYYAAAVINGKLTQIHETCRIGQSHSLQNVSKDKWAVVDFRKWK